MTSTKKFPTPWHCTARCSAHSVQKQLVIVPASQLLPAGGTVAVEPDTLGQAVGAEDVAACGRQEMVAWVGRSSSGSNERSLTFAFERGEGLHADWALDAGDRVAGGMDSGTARSGPVRTVGWVRGVR